MHRYRKALIVIVLVASVTSLTAAYPLANIVFNDNQSGWFTTDNIGEYGNDLDSRVDPGDPIFTGHPSYVMGSDNARMLFDMPRIHYYGNTFLGTWAGDRFYRNLTVALENGEAEYAISGPMTEKVLELNASAEQAFTKHYCRVETDGLYEKTNAELYRYVENTSDCPEDRLPDVENMSSK